MLRLLRNAELYDPAPRGRCHLVIGGGRIGWIGQTAPAIPRELLEEDVDLGGRRVIPGLIDGHVHLTGGGGEAGPETRVPPLHLTELTLGGITTAVGVLGTDDVVRTPAELVTVVHGFRAQGISAWCHTGGYHLPPATVTGSVRRDIVLLEPVLGVGEVAVSDHRSSQPTIDALLAVAAEAHVGGLMSGKAGIVHLHLGDGERGLAPVREALDRSELPPRVFNPTHVNRRRGLFDEAMALAERGCVIDVSAFPVEEGEDAWTAEDALLRYLDAGLPPERITVSSDGGGAMPTFDAQRRVVAVNVARPGAVAATLKALLTRGLPLERVLPAFTLNPARLLRLDAKGRLAPGTDADLAVLHDDGGMLHVMARGRWMVRDGRPVVRGPFEGEDR